MAGKSPKPIQVALKGDLDVFSIQGQATGLKQALEGAGPFVVDLSGVGDVDLSGFQLLASTTVGRAPGTIRLQGIPPALLDRMQELGLQAFLDEVK